MRREIGNEIGDEWGRLGMIRNEIRNERGY